MDWNAMSAWVPGRAAVFEWTVKDSLLGYMLRDETFTWEGSGGATFDPERGVSVPGVIGDDGVLRLTGEITLSAHGGSLAVALVAAELDPEKGLSIADPIDGLPRRMTLVTVKPVDDAAVPTANDADTTEDDDLPASGTAANSAATVAPATNAEGSGATLCFATFLGYDADILFMYKYSTRTPFDDIRVTLVG